MGKIEADMAEHEAAEADDDELEFQQLLTKQDVLLRPINSEQNTRSRPRCNIDGNQEWVVDTAHVPTVIPPTLKP